MNLKQQLIRLGYERPDLRNHLRPVIETVDTNRQKSAVEIRDGVTWGSAIRSMASHFIDAVFDKAMGDVEEIVRSYDGVTFVEARKDIEQALSVVIEHGGETHVVYVSAESGAEPYEINMSASIAGKVEGGSWNIWFDATPETAARDILGYVGTTIRRLKKQG